jgi:hypothetical protein
MHRVGRDKLSIDQLKDLSKKNYEEYLPKCKPEYKHMSYPSDDKIKDNDIVLFVFGEIDIRNHYAKQLSKGRNETEIIHSLVNNYIADILENRKQYSNVKFGLQSVNPPTDEKNLKEEIKEYPIAGTIEQRIRATIEINNLLKQKCKEHGLIFIDTASYYQNDESLFPVNGLSDEASLYEMDPRIKDANVHVHMENPEGIEHAFKLANIPINIKYYDYKRKCKYSGSLNKFQRDSIIRFRTIHYILVLLLGLSLFIPNRFFLVTLTYWAVIIALNIGSANGLDCFFNMIEFRMSNCNNKTLFDEIGIPKDFKNIIWYSCYIMASIILIFRTYYYFNKKNLFNLKFGLKFLKY